MDGNYCYVVLCAAALFSSCSAELLTPYRGHGPWRSHRQIRSALQDLGFNDTFEEIVASNSPVSYGLDYEVHRFIDTLWREDGSEANLLGHLTVVGRPKTMVSVTDPFPNGCSDRYWTSRNTVLNTATHRKCLVAMNAGFFRGSGACLGAVVSDRSVSQKGDNKQNPVFAITEDGRIQIGYVNNMDIKDGAYVQMVSGVIWLVRNGSSFVNSSIDLESAEHEETGTMTDFVSVISSRTAIGHDAEGRVMFVHIEGQTRKRGVNLWEFSDMLIKHGFVNAINLDGGGSGTTVIRDVVASYPSDHCGNPIYRCGRKVSTIVCVHEVQCYPSDCNGHGKCVDGECQCHAPYVGVDCNLLNCSLAHCSGQGTCDKGICSCEAGWTGTHCNVTCPTKTYGPDCKQKCSWCNTWYSHMSHCDRFNGTWMCEDGYKGSCCKQQCDDGWYGADCSRQCNCSSHGTCSHITGVCKCQQDWTGENCSSAVTTAPPSTQTANRTNATSMLTSVMALPSSPSETDSNGTETHNADTSSVAVPVWFVAVAVLLVCGLLVDAVYRRVLPRRCVVTRRLRAQSNGYEQEHLMSLHPDTDPDAGHT